MSKPRPFHLPGARATSLVRQRACAALTAWAREWVGAMSEENPLTTLSLEPVQEEDLSSGLVLEELRGANGSLWIRRSPRDRQNFGEAVVRAELMPHSVCADDWIAAIADDAWSARNRALCEALVGTPGTAQSRQSTLPASLTAAGSGAVTIGFEPWGLFAIADAGIWSRLPPPETRVPALPPLVSLEHATLRSSLQIEVTLGGAELELPKLIDLRTGDVLLLGTRLDDPLCVSCERLPFARAVLGDSAGHKSIQFTGKHS